MIIQKFKLIIIKKEKKKRKEMNLINLFNFVHHRIAKPKSQPALPMIIPQMAQIHA
jgi:hypothetical protein